MAKSNVITKDQLGAWSFILGLALAIILAFVAVNFAWLLILLGIIVGLLNIQDKEVTQFLVAAIALIAVGSADVNILGIPLILSNIVTFVSPAAVIVAVKAVYAIGRK